jgi:hypothetical protein
MLGKKQTSYLSKCRKRIRMAEAYRKSEELDDLWDRLNDLYRGKHFENLTSDDRIAVNLAFSTINVIAPSIAVNYPKVTVAARKPEQNDNALIVETIVNYWWRIYDIRPEFRAAVKDFLMFGFGWLKTGYRFVEEEVDKDPEALDAEYGAMREQADVVALQDIDNAGTYPTDEEIEANLVTTELRVVEDRPFVERVSIHDVYVDPEAKTLRDARWIAQKILKDPEEVQSNDNYKKSARNKVKPNAVVDDKYWPEAEARSKSKDKDAARITVWEYYDLRAGTMCVFPESGDDFFVDPVAQPYAFGHPFVMLRNYDVPDQFYPMGELEAIESLQQELNKTRSQIMNDRRRYARKYLYNPRAFDNSAVGDLQSQRDQTFVAVNEDVPLTEAVIPVPQVPLDSSFYQQSEQIESDINTISGVSEYARGGGDQAIRRTATEASIIQDAANSRVADKLSLIEDGIASVARRLVQLAQQYLTEPQMVRVVGNNGHPLWVEWEPEWIQGEYDFDVEAGSTKPQNESFLQNQSLGLLQAMEPFIPLGVVNVEELLKYVLQKGFAIKEPSKFIQAAPLPLGGPPPGMLPPGMEPPPGEGAPPGGGEAPSPQEVPPDAQIPPELLAQSAQLQGQVGLTLPSLQ